MEENNKLYVIEFSIKFSGKGCAVVKANSPKEAERLLKTEGRFNGNPRMYEITRIEEIISSPLPMLLAEQIN